MHILHIDKHILNIKMHMLVILHIMLNIFHIIFPILIIPIPGSFLTIFLALFLANGSESQWKWNKCSLHGGFESLMAVAETVTSASPASWITLLFAVSSGLPTYKEAQSRPNGDGGFIFSTVGMHVDGVGAHLLEESWWSDGSDKSNTRKRLHRPRDKDV